MESRKAGQKLLTAAAVIGMIALIYVVGANLHTFQSDKIESFKENFKLR